MALGLPFDVVKLRRVITYIDRKLDQIERRTSCLSVRFDDLSDERVCASVFEYCLPYRHDTVWWSMMNALNLQTNMVATIRYMVAYGRQLQKLAKTAKYVSISKMRPHVNAIDGMTIGEESFDTFYRDSAHMFRDHMFRTNQDIEDYTRKNLDLMRHANERGNLQVITARSNGRVFGYLMAAIAESFDAVGAFEGVHLAFYASPEFPGLGLKLQRASIDALRAKGVGDLYLRAGSRGSGPRLGSMYRRLGAEDAGQLFHLCLGTA